MALADSNHAIGAVSELLEARLSANTSATSVDIGRPESASASAGPKYNLFLYQVDIDAPLRNQSLDAGQKTPLWLVLRFLMTAFDENSESDSADAHKLLGEGMLALNELNFVHPSTAALAQNPEPLKITFDSADSELLSKIMQGADEKYRVSAAFQVRPIMIAPTEPPNYSLPVKTVGPPGDEGVVLVPTLGPRLESVAPSTFIAGTELTIQGTDVNSSISEVLIGEESFAISAAIEGEVQTTIPITTSLSAGTYPLCLVLDIGSGRELDSDSLLVKLLPDVQSATPSGLTTTGSDVHGTLDITGTLLGGVDDVIYVAFYAAGEVALMLEATGTAAQTTLTVTVSADDAIPAGDYFIILRVNGAQAADAPEVTWS